MSNVFHFHGFFQLFEHSFCVFQTFLQHFIRSKEVNEDQFTVEELNFYFANLPSQNNIPLIFSNSRNNMSKFNFNLTSNSKVTFFLSKVKQLVVILSQ